MRNFYRSLVSKEDELSDAFVPLCRALRNKGTESATNVFKSYCNENNVMGCIIDVRPDVPPHLRTIMTVFPKEIALVIHQFRSGGSTIFKAEIKTGGVNEHVWSSNKELEAYKRDFHEDQSFYEMCWCNRFQGPVYDQMRKFGRTLQVKYRNRRMLNANKLPEIIERPLCFNFNVDMEGTIFMYTFLRIFFSKHSGASVGVRIDFPVKLMPEIFEHVYKDETKVLFTDDFANLAFGFE